MDILEAADRVAALAKRLRKVKSADDVTIKHLAAVAHAAGVTLQIDTPLLQKLKRKSPVGPATAGVRDFFAKFKGEHNVGQIVDHAGEDHKAVRNSLDYLVRIGEIKRVARGAYVSAKPTGGDE